MPGTKRKFSKFSPSSTPRTAAKKFRAARKRVFKSRVSRSLPYSKAVNQHMYQRYATTPTEFTMTTAEQPQAEKFQLNYIKGYSEFVALYDRYKITSVEMQITLINNPDSYWGPNPSDYTLTTNGVQGRSNWYPKMWYVRDYDDENTISLSAIKERANVKCIIMRPNKIYKIRIRPAVLAQTYATAVSTGYAPKWKQWIDMQQQDVPHYGIKYVMDAQGLDPSDNYPFKFRVEYKYHFTCKDVL